MFWSSTEVQPYHISSNDNELSDLERPHQLDVFKFTKRGMRELAESLRYSQVLGFGQEGVAFHQSFFIGPQKDGHLHHEFSEGIRTNMAIKIFNKWNGAVKFFSKLAHDHYDPNFRQELVGKLSRRVISDNDWTFSYVEAINRKNASYELLPANAFPVNTIYLTPKNRILGFSVMEIPNGEWLHWIRLSSDEQAIFQPVKGQIDNIGDDNFVRYQIPFSNGSSQITAVNDLRSF